MLKRLHVDNFKSLLNITYEPGPVNVLVGRNNSGKTNFCEAVKFLQLSVYHPLALVALNVNADPSLITNMYLSNDFVSFEVGCDLEDQGAEIRYAYELQLRVSKPSLANPTGGSISVESELLRATGGPFAEPSVLFSNKAGKIRLLHEGRSRKSGVNSSSYVETVAPTDATMLSRLYDLEHNHFANLFKRYIGGWQYFNFDATKLRSSEAKPTGWILNPDGSNLTYALFQLKTLDERTYRNFISAVKLIEPKIDALNFLPPVQDSVFMFLTDAKGRTFPPTAISEGTLRFMAMAYVLCTCPVAARQTAQAAPLILIEEPENGIYVGLLKELMSYFGLAGPDEPQVILTTHSPYLIDLFDQRLESLTVVKSDNSHTQFSRPDTQSVRRLLEIMPLGEMYYRDLIA